jgi:hypothetical protein
VMHLRRSTVLQRAGAAPQSLREALQQAAEDLLGMRMNDLTCP